MTDSDILPTWPQQPEALRVALQKLPDYCLQQRWYPAKDAGLPTISLRELQPLTDGEIVAALALWDIAVSGREPFVLFIPLAVLPRAQQGSTPSIGELPNGERLVDAVGSDAFLRLLLRFMLGEARPNSSALRPGHTGRIEALCGAPAPRWRLQRSSVEQSNTSVRVGDVGILKLIRKVAVGIHPELEMAQFLTETARYGAAPALLGWINFAGHTVAILQEFIPNEGDGWSRVRALLRGGPQDGEKARAWLATLGRRTAELHAALGCATTEPAFVAEAAGPDDWQRWARDLASMAERARDALRAGEPKLDPSSRRLATEFRDGAVVLNGWLASIVARPPVWRKTRHHGDFHLGQVLVKGDDAVIVDFEGEPMRALEERRAKHVPLRDVAGMLRSIRYAAASLQRELPADLPDEVRRRETARLDGWADDASRQFMDSYLGTLEQQVVAAPDLVTARGIVQFFLFEKALYEVLYELSNRPDWVSIPLQSVVSQLAEMKASAGTGANTSAERRCYPMPFGAQLQAGGVRFRFWAPEWPEVSVAFQAPGAARTVKMTSAGEGWHELIEAGAGAGTRYDFIAPDGMHVPDPASRFQPDDVHGPSEVIDPAAFAWSADWQGRSWAETVIYELHVGTFTEAGTFRAAIDKLDHLVTLGINAIELMPIADFPGKRNWGYDGVLWYAPDSSYGRPEELKALVDAAHARGISVLLDVVYNHFGPDGNFLPSYAPKFFTDRHKTPWGAAVNYDGPHAQVVRDFVLHNALFWLEEYNLDGLRLDAVHAIMDDSPRHLLEELAARARALSTRPLHLLLENEDNSASWLSRDDRGIPEDFSAQWNDDVHHVLHVAATGERQGYYGDYHGQTEKLGRALAEGFAFQGETMPFSGRERGEPSAHLPPSAFVAFIQNHDQIGNRAFGDRISQVTTPAALRAIAAIYLLLPQVPMLFMGEEWGSEQPFPFFCDFDGELGEAVRKGRRQEFAKFPEFHDEANRERIPDPQAESTFVSAKLHWNELDAPAHAAWFELYRRLLAARRTHILPLLGEVERGGEHEVLGDNAVRVSWQAAGDARLMLVANLSDTEVSGHGLCRGNLIWDQGGATDAVLPPWTVRWSLTARAPS
jgi:malto-oligosyltrehalose trehalohydrolase